MAALNDIHTCDLSLTEPAFISSKLSLCHTNKILTSNILVLIYPRLWLGSGIGFFTSFQPTQRTFAHTSHQQAASSLLSHATETPKELSMGRVNDKSGESWWLRSKIDTQRGDAKFDGYDLRYVPRFTGSEYRL